MNTHKTETAMESRGLVLYTDGSARPNPGFTGFGAHGYIYSMEKLKGNISYPERHVATTKGYVAKNNVTDSVVVYPVKYIDILIYITYRDVTKLLH